MHKILILVASFLLVRCAGGLEREACYAQLEAQAADRALHECFEKGWEWDQCPSRHVILDDLRNGYRGCP
jgi:hypothetical protein